MALTVVGSVAFDSITTPFGTRERVLGGSAVHFSLAASYFTQVRLVGVVGDDFGESERAVLEGRGIDTHDLEVVPGGEVKVQNTPEARAQVIEIVKHMRVARRTKAEVHRTHNTGYNCRRCLNHGTCGEAKVA